MRRDDYYLFTKYSLNSVISSHTKSTLEKLGLITKEEVETNTEEALIEKYCDEFIINELILHEGDIEQEAIEKDVDVSHRTDLYWSTPGPHSKRGTLFRYYLPFSGDDILLDCQPSTFSFTPPYAKHANNQLIFEFEIVHGDNTDPDNMLEGELVQIRSMVETVNKDIAPFNSQLRELVVNAISKRKEQIAALGAVLQKSKYRTRSNGSSDVTYPSLSIKKKEAIKVNVDRTGSHPEPVLASAEYERILEIVKHTGRSLERNYNTYSAMGEEELRDVLLTQLNGHYEGKAAGEAFNAEGKTDILVRDSDKNIFIGECKIWTGPAAFSAAIDQLLGYTSWRDTKTALIIFSRNKDTTAVIDQIDELVKKHDSFKRDLGKKDESDFRYVLRHRSDASKELFLAVQILDVPSKVSS
jgi:hypothetical protein